MPFIDAKISVKATEEKKEIIKSEFGKLMSVLGKSETYLMVGIEDGYSLWMGGKKLEKGAYVSVSLLGNAPSASYEKLTAEICSLFEKELGISGSSVYVTYHPVSDWGWNGANFCELSILFTNS